MSPKPVLYGHPQSPFHRIAAMTLDVLGVDYEYKFVDLFAGESKKPEFVQKNLQHNIPFLVDGDFSLNESVAIAIYLAEKYGSGEADSLYPTGKENLKARTKINQRLCFNNLVFMDAFGQAFRPLVFRGVKEIDPTHVARLKEVFTFIQHFIKATGFIAETKEVSVADLACLSTYTTIVATKDVCVDVNEYPDVVAWAERIKNLVPHYEEANGKGVKIFEEFFRSKTGLI